MKNIWKIFNYKRNRTLEYLGYKRVKVKGQNHYFDINDKEVFSGTLLYVVSSDSEVVMLRRFIDKDFLEVYDLDGKFLKIIEKSC